MCGIVAIHHPDRSLERPLCENALTAVKHRGPDDTRIERKNGWTIGVNRLSILDDEGGTQPLTVEDVGGILAFNGEIYNHANLRPGCTGDTQALFSLLQEDGCGAIGTLEGQFAFVFVKTDGNLIVARDQLGIKPLYYAGTMSDGMIIASELKALAGWPGPFSTVLPGHIFDGVDQHQFAPRLPSPKQGNLRELISAAVRKRIPPDNRVGVLLSGGIDSSIIAYEAAQASEVTLFTVQTPNGRDEQYARLMAGHLGSRHVSRIIGNNIEHEIERIVYHLENYREIAVLNAIPQFHACRMAAEQGLKVVMGGEGADELFWGYDFLDGFGREHFAVNRIAALEQLFRNELQRADRMSSAFGLEYRVPFLDQGVISHALSLEIDDLVVRVGSRERKKEALRRAYRGILPDEILRRPKENMYRSTGIEALLGSNKHYDRAAEQSGGWPVESQFEELTFGIFSSRFDLAAMAPRSEETEDPTRVIELEFIPRRTNRLPPT